MKRTVTSISIAQHHFLSSRLAQILNLLFFVAAILYLMLQVPAYANPKYAGLVINADTGEVLYQEDAGSARYPASLTKMMTLYVTFDMLEHGKLTMDQKLPVSAFAASQPPSKLGLKKGERISVRDAILALIVKSSNDVAVVLAEAIGGSEWQFARIMTQRAHDIGMKNTTFINASGLHDNRQITTAYDLARLAVALQQHHSQYYYLFAHTNFKYKGKTFPGHNRVTQNYRGADGLKTGYTNPAGFNLATSAKRGKTRLVGVVLGGNSSRSRDAQMIKLLDQGFMQIARKDGDTQQFASAPASQYQKTAKSKSSSAQPIAKLALNDNNEVPRKPVASTRYTKSANSAAGSKSTPQFKRASNKIKVARTKNGKKFVSAPRPMSKPVAGFEVSAR